MKKTNQQILKSFSMVGQVGISMLVPIFLGAFLGIKLDEWLDTGFCFIVLLLLGIAAAFRNVYLLTRRFYSKDLEKENREQKYFDDLFKDRKK